MNYFDNFLAYHVLRPNNNSDLGKDLAGNRICIPLLISSSRIIGYPQIGC